MHKDYKCLDPSTRRIYISHDVVFDEKLFPFAVHQSAIGAQYTSDILLLPESYYGNNGCTNTVLFSTCSLLPVVDSVGLQYKRLPHPFHIT
jgi:hypothetical protein